MALAKKSTHLQSCKNAGLFGIGGITPWTWHAAEALCFGVKSIPHTNHSTHLARGCGKRDVTPWQSSIHFANCSRWRIAKERGGVASLHSNLTHSSLAVGVGVHLAIVLDDGQASWDGGHHLIVTILWARTAGRLLTAAFIAIVHPEWVSPLTLWTGGAFSLNGQGRESVVWNDRDDKTACLNK